MDRILKIASVALIMTGCGAAKQSEFAAVSNGQEKVYVRVPNAMLSQEWVAAHGFNRDHAKNAQYALGWIQRSSFETLTSAEKSAITELDEKQVTHGFLNPFTLEEIKRFDGGDPTAGYHDYTAMTQELQDLANAHADIAELSSIGKSTEGRNLWMMRITGQIGQDSRKPKLLYIANMHGDEVIGRELSIHHIRRLLTDYGSDERITNLVNNADLYIMPSMNPDGFERGQRASARGVDLNRDFPDFTSDNQDNPNGRAIETAAVMSLHQQHHFISAVNFHGGTVCFNLPWDTKPNSPANQKFGDDAVLWKMGRAWADTNRTMYSNTEFDHGLTYGYEWYEVDGGMQDWSIYYRRSMHATVELSYTKWPSASQIPVAWNENKEAMLAYLERSIVGVHVEAVDNNGNPVDGITVSSSTSRRDLTFDHNYASRTTTDGAQTVTVKAPGYKPATIQLTARSFDGQFDRVVLTK